MIEALPRRKPLRLGSYDYSQAGVYFVTICTRGRNCILGKIRPDRTWIPSELGALAGEELAQIPVHRPNVTILHSVVMPNHVHILLQIHPASSDGGRGTTCRARLSGEGSFGSLLQDSLSTIIGAYKAAVTRRWRQMTATTSRGPTPKPIPVWQTRYHDHVVRNDADYLRIWNYIDTNPAQWAEDQYYIP